MPCAVQNPDLMCCAFVFCPRSLLSALGALVSWSGGSLPPCCGRTVYRVNVHLVANQDAIKGNFTVDTNVVSPSQVGPAMRQEQELDVLLS